MYHRPTKTLSIPKFVHPIVGIIYESMGSSLSHPTICRPTPCQFDGLATPPGTTHRLHIRQRQIWPAPAA